MNIFKFFLLFFISWQTFATENKNLTIDLVPLDQLATKYFEDAKRIEVYYPKQFQRLEMDWQKTVQKYIQEYKKAKSPEAKIQIFARLYNSYNNGHHRRLGVKGLLKYEPEDRLQLPIQIFGQGLHFSQARFFVSGIAKSFKDPSIQVGDEVVQYNGIDIRDYAVQVRDEVSTESPEWHISAIARNMAFQFDCRWGKLNCWRPNEKTTLQLKGKDTGNLKTIKLAWGKADRKAFEKPSETPIFPEEEVGWSFRSINGPYAFDFDAIPDPHTGFMGQLIKEKKTWLIIKLFSVTDEKLVQEAIKEARKPEYDGVILDFGGNGGGNDIGKVFLAGLLGTQFHLELNSVRLIKEFQDFEVLKEASMGAKKAEFLFPFVKAVNFNKMSPFTAVCMDSTCPVKTEYSHYLDFYEKPAVLSNEPIKKIAIITGMSTASIADSIANVFRATKVGPIVGTPAIASSGSYYFRKDYVVSTGDKAFTVSVSFTPDFSLAADCEVSQANPPQPDVLIERTFENRKYYDTLTWIKSVSALENWKTPANIGITCPIERAKEKLRSFGLKQITIQ